MTKAHARRCKNLVDWPSTAEGLVCTRGRKSGRPVVSRIDEAEDHAYRRARRWGGRCGVGGMADLRGGQLPAGRSTPPLPTASTPSGGQQGREGTREV